MKQRTNPLPVTFSQQLQQKKGQRAWSVFGLYEMTLGIVLFVVFGIRTLCAVGLACIAYTVLTALGIALVCIGFFRPLLLQRPAKHLQKAFNYFAKKLLQLLLLPIYAVFCLLALCKQRKKAVHNYSFVQWRSTTNCPEPVFQPYTPHVYSAEKHSVFRLINYTLLFFSENGMQLLLPLVFLLLFLGAFFFIASTESVFVFLYALF